MRDSIKRILFYSLLLFALFSYTAQAKPIVADISSHEIKITSDFTGITLLIYGARLKSGDIVIVIRGPEKNFTIRKKERVWGVWVNRESKTINHIPYYYSFNTAKPFEEIEKSILMDKLRIAKTSIVDKSQAAPFMKALHEYLHQNSLHSFATPISFIGETLFKTTITFPANLPRGNYTAEAYLISDGNIVGMQSTPIRVYKSGFDAFIYDAAQNNKFLYGIAAVFIALFSGWLASELFIRL